MSSREEDLTLKLLVDASEASKLEDVAKTTGKIDGTTATVTAVVDDKASAPLGDVKDTAQQLDGEQVSIPVEATGAAEAATAVDGVGDAVESNVAKARRLWPEMFTGVDQLKQDYTELTGEVVRSGDETEAALRKPGAAAKQSGGEITNMTGNAAQDLAGLAGASGTAAQGIGNIAQKAIEAVSAFGGMAAVTGIGAVVGVALVGMQKAAEKTKRAIADIGDAMKDLGKVSDAQVLETFNRMVLDTVKGSKNLNDVLKDLAETQPENARRTLALMDATEGYDKVANILREDLATADAERAQQKQTNIDYADSTTAMADASKDSAEQAQAQADAMEAARQAAQDQSDAMRSAADATFALHDQQQRFQETLDKLPDKLTAAGGELLAVRAALDDVATSAGGVADAQVRMADETAKATGKTLTATEKLDIWNQSMLTQASTVNGPARDAILNYIGTVNDIPPDKLTEISALIDQGKLDEAQAKLDEASKNRSTTVTATANTKPAEDAINTTINKDRDPIVLAVQVALGNAQKKISGFVTGNSGTVNANASGTALPVPAGVTTEGDDGLLRTESPTVPITIGPVSGPRAAGTAVTNNTIIVNVPRGYRELDAATASHRVAQRSGRLYARR